MTIEVRDLRLVVVTAEHGSFRRAAHALRVRASSVSRRIKKLEDALGVPLFARSSSGVRLTAAGRHLLIYACDDCDRLARLRQTIAAFRPSRQAEVSGEQAGVLTSATSVPVQQIALSPEIVLALVESVLNTIRTVSPDLAQFDEYFGATGRHGNDRNGNRTMLSNLPNGDQPS